MNWRNALGVLCDCRIPIKLEGNIYKAANSPALLDGIELCAVKKQYIHNMSIAEMRMLR